MNWHDYFYYDETSPSCLRWKVNRRVARKDAIAGCKNDIGYWGVGLFGRVYMVHRVIWELHNPELGASKVDHIDGNPSNNVLSNLRPATTSENAMNKRKSCRSISGYKGVSWKTERSRWRASIEINVDGKRRSMHVGYFKEAIDAARAYDAKAIELFGKFALTNFTQ